MNKISNIRIKWATATFTLVVLSTLLSSCKMADLRTTEIKNGTQSKAEIALAQNLLDEAVKKHGFDKIDRFKTYEIIANDHWKGMLGKAGNPWDWGQETIAFRFSVGDFDGQVEVLEGEKQGFLAGIQSWDYYEKVGERFDTNVEDDERKIFNLAAIHYFSELAHRLQSKATFVRYAGEGVIRGIAVDKIFISWENNATENYDHYVLWVSKETSLIEAVEFTTREAPAPKFLTSAIQFENYQSIDGVFIPFKQSVQLNEPDDDTSKFIHQITVKKFTWDSFPSSDLTPLSGVKSVGDEKPYKN